MFWFTTPYVPPDASGACELSLNSATNVAVLESNTGVLEIYTASNHCDAVTAAPKLVTVHETGIELPNTPVPGALADVRARSGDAMSIGTANELFVVSISDCCENWLVTNTR